MSTQRRLRYAFGVPGALFGSALLGPAAFAQQPGPVCSQVSLGALVNQIVPSVLPGSIAPITGTPFVQIIAAAPPSPANPPRQPTPIPETPAYCQVTFNYLPGGSGPD